MTRLISAPAWMRAPLVNFLRTAYQANLPFMGRGFCGPWSGDDSTPHDLPWFSFVLGNHGSAYVLQPLVDKFSSRHIRWTGRNNINNMVLFSSSNHRLMYTQTGNNTTNYSSVKHKNVALPLRASALAAKPRKTKAFILLCKRLKSPNLQKKCSKKTVA